MTTTTGINEKHSYTEIEIKNQPQLWQEVFELLKKEENKIKDFLSPLFQKENLQVILTGAGSSAFVGEAAQGLVQKNTGCTTKAIATTDLVTHPDLYFPSDSPTLLVSFARSGNSPESLETVYLADDFCKEVYHLIITCNIEGELHKYAGENKHNSFSILLPEAANDKSLAMTGSFTSMLLTVLLVGSKRDLQEKEQEVQATIAQAELILENQDAFKSIAEKEFERVVFLGSGPMLGIARECHLKLQELTDGQVICKHDSFLGFRHGPRAVVKEKTLMVYLFSPKDHVFRYELDLAESIAQDPRNIPVISIGRPEEKNLHPILNLDLEATPLKELQVVSASLIGQLLGFFKSINLGLNPDNPSVSGSISRVVQGVTIYDFPKS